MARDAAAAADRSASEAGKLYPSYFTSAVQD